MSNVLTNRLSPLIKYPGGKEKELNYIIPALPAKIDNYYEPFVGGGAVYFSIEAKKYYINDKSDEFLEAHNYSRDEIKAGLKDITVRYGVDGFAEMFLQ